VALPEHLSKTPVGREPLAREVIDAHKRERIVAVAIEVFAKRGYRATTIEHIVAAAQVAVGSFYALFEGKEGCFLHCFDAVVAEATESTIAAVPDGASWGESVSAALAFLLDSIAAAPLRARIVFVEAQATGAAAEARYEATLDDVASSLRRGRELSSAAAGLPRGFERTTLAGLAWLIHQRLVGAEPEKVPELFPEVAEILLEPYLGEDEASRLLAVVPGAGT
jgi:Transcriptional regulator